MSKTPVDTGRKWNVHKTFRRRPGRLLNVLCTFNLRPVSMGIVQNGIILAAQVKDLAHAVVQTLFKDQPVERFEFFGAYY